MRSLLDFIKYNNAVPLILAVLLLGTGVVFAANPAVREALFPTDAGPLTPPPAARTEVLLATDLEAFDMAFRVDAVVEAGQSYRIGYSYRTLEVAADAWQVVPKAKNMDIPKDLLGKRDLGLYAAEQIGQVMDREIAYLSEVQARARKPDPRGAASGEYAGLVGKTLDAEDKRFEAYKPVVKEEKKEEGKKKGETETTITVELPSGSVPATSLLTKEEVRQIIVDAVANFLAIDTVPVAPTPEPVEPTEIEAAPDETIPSEPDPEDSQEMDNGNESSETAPETAVLDSESVGE